MTRSTIVAERNTGNYHVSLVRDRDGLYELVVLYTGPWGSGDAVSLPVDDLETLLDEEVGSGRFSEWDAIARKWLKDALAGDFDVAARLAAEGFDEYTNDLGR